MFARASACLLLLGCVSTSAPADAPAPAPLADSSWTGRLTRTTHRYSNGCTDHRTIEVLALAIDTRRAPIIIGWRRRSPTTIVEPHFLTREEELPQRARGAACVTVTGAVVEYAYEGIAAIPARALEATRIEPSACP